MTFQFQAGQFSGVSRSSFRFTTPIPITATTSGATDVVYARPIPIKSDARNLTVKMGNALFNGGRGNSVVCDVAVYTSDGSGNATGSPLAKWLAQTIPGDGTLWTSPTTITIPTAGSDGKIVVLHGLPALTDVGLVGQCNYGTYSLGTLTVDPPPAPSAVDPNPVFLIYVDYTTTRRQYVELGDSISVADVATTGFSIAAWNQVAVNKGIAAGIKGVSGGTLAQFADPVTYPLLWDFPVNSRTKLIIQAGVNSLPTGAAQMFTDLTTIVNYARNTLGIALSNIHPRTVAPQVSYAGGAETARIDYNILIRANSLGLGAYYDAAAAQPAGLADNVDTTILYPPYSADGTHTSDDGQTAEAADWGALAIF